ncbi:ArsR/SmtB family transcription factor [Pseudonocardia spinosispora]|uniref:ArsR/SmtB family transcription factor n=1 Tax=Pseudonocardia spinosispora TaxID=103441 RepID=UPI0004153BF6|nr:helix-turn-helix transcriptional regulator [Pseudonocardia spinosispora]
MREPWQPATEDIELAQVMHALADPVRLEIVARLARTPGLACTAAASGIDLHKSTMSHHYQVLREAGVTLTRLDGRTRLVELRRDDLDARFPGLLDAVLTALAHRTAARA